jgi:hypothetical protein
MLCDILFTSYAPRDGPPLPRSWSSSCIVRILMKYVRVSVEYCNAVRLFIHLLLLRSARWVLRVRAHDRRHAAGAKRCIGVCAMIVLEASITKLKHYYLSEESSISKHAPWWLTFHDTFQGAWLKINVPFQRHFPGRDPGVLKIKPEH